MRKKKKLLITLSLLILMYSIWSIAGGLLEDTRSDVQREALPALSPGGKTINAPLNLAASDHTVEGQKPTILPEYRELYAQNSDMVGWVSIEGTSVDYPVMQRSQDNEYYLNHDFEGKRNKNGLPFLDEGCNAQESNILLVYGHNMKNGRMFGGLMEYKDKGFYDAHPTIRFDTLHEAAEFEIVAVLRSRVYLQTEEAFRYYRLEGTETSDGFKQYVQSVQERSLYHTGVSVRYGHQLLILSTCEYSTQNGRLVVIAKKVA